MFTQRVLIMLIVLWLFWAYPIVKPTLHIRRSIHKRNTRYIFRQGPSGPHFHAAHARHATDSVTRCMTLFCRVSTYAQCNFHGEDTWGYSKTVWIMHAFIPSRKSFPTLILSIILSLIKYDKHVSNFSWFFFISSLLNTSNISSTVKVLFLNNDTFLNSLKHLILHELVYYHNLVYILIYLYCLYYLLI